jgi:hypothetical protein
MRFAVDDSDDGNDGDSEKTVTVENIRVSPDIDACLVDSMASLHIPGAWPKGFAATGAQPHRSHSNKQPHKHSFHYQHTPHQKIASSHKRDSTVHPRKTPINIYPKATRRPSSKKASGSFPTPHPHSYRQRPVPNVHSPPLATMEYIRHKRRAQEILAAADRLAERLRARGRRPGIFGDHDMPPRRKPPAPSTAKNPHTDGGAHHWRTGGPDHTHDARLEQEQARTARHKVRWGKTRPIQEEREPPFLREQETIEQAQMADSARVAEARRRRTEAWARHQRATFLERKRAVLAEQRALDPWTLYETAWKAISSPQNSPPTVRLGEIPWPVKRPPGHPHGEELPLWFLSLNNIRTFLLSPDRFVAKSNRVRLREALLIWHPDRFESRLKAKVPPEEWERVFEGCQAVIRVLNDPKLIHGLE